MRKKNIISDEERIAKVYNQACIVVDGEIIHRPLIKDELLEIRDIIDNNLSSK